jgi:hypothetical protein
LCRLYPMLAPIMNLKDSTVRSRQSAAPPRLKALKVWLQFLPDPEWGLRLIPATFQSIQEILTFRNLIQQNTSTND